MPRYRCAIVSVALATGRRLLSGAVAVLLALHCIPGLTCLKAQTSSVIEGALTDPQGMVIVGADISLSGSGMGETRFLSDSSGSLSVKGPTDSFVGMVPVVKDPVSGQTNANGPFTASNGNPVPQAGRLYNGANLDRGPSDLAVNHTLLLDGIVRLPWRFEASGIFRAQSGFHFSAALPTLVDVDGDGVLNGVDFRSGRNALVGPAYANLDARFSKRFPIRETGRVQVLFEFFNLLNRANTAAVEQLQNVSTPLGTPLQRLPEREGQVGVRIEF